MNSIYSIGYMRAQHEPRQTGFYSCFAVALGSTMGVALAADLFTLFLFYELLTLSTYPLVTHRRDAEAMRAGRLYLGLLLGTSMLLFLPAIIATYAFAGIIEFTPGGVLSGHAGPVALVFGREDKGLSNEDLDLCHRVVNIPSDPEYSSMNLGHAVAVMLYELAVARENAVTVEEVDLAVHAHPPLS